MIVALDIGNTHLRLGVIESGDVASSRQARTNEAEIEATLGELLSEEGASLSEVTTAVVASVVPALTTRLSELAARHGFELLIANAGSIPMPIRVDFPAGVGDDRLVNALAASRLYGAPAIVVDLGTATTFDVVDAEGAFLGGAIAPGVGLGIEALVERTAQLPRVPLALPPQAIGQNTFEAIQSGAVLGYVGLVDYLVNAMSAVLTTGGGERPKVILTGGLASLSWAEAIRGVDAIDPLLTLRGLAIFHSDARRSTEVVSA